MCPLLAGQVLGAGGEQGAMTHRLLGSRDGLEDSAYSSTCTGFLLNYPAVVDQPKSLLKPNLESMPGCWMQMEELKLLFLCAFHSLTAQDHIPGQKLWELAMGCSVKSKPNIIIL